MLENNLSKLEANGLIRLAQSHPEYEYLFRHALVQDAAYESLLKSDRRGLHEKVAETIEVLYPSRLDELAAVLAYHYEKAENEKQALKYTLLAADSAARTYANREAANLYQRAIRTALRGKSDFTGIQARELYTKYGRALELSGQYERARDAYHELEGIGQQRDDRQLELVALIALATIYATPSPLYDLVTANDLCQRGLDLARPLGDLDAQSQILWLMMLASYFNSEVAVSIQYGEEALSIARALDNQERIAFVLNDIVRGYGSIGQMEKAFAASAEARAIWIEQNNQPMLADNLSTYSQGLMINGRFEEALQNADQALEISEKINNIWGKCYALLMQAYVLLQFGHIDETIRKLEAILEWNKLQAVPFAYLTSLILLGEIYTEIGFSEKAQAMIDHFVSSVDTYAISYKSPILAFAAFHAAKTGNYQDATGYLEKIERIFDPSNFNTYAPFYYHEAIYLVALHNGTYLEGAAVLEKAIGNYARGGIIAPLPSMHYWLGCLLLAVGQTDGALVELNRAAEMSADRQARQVHWRVQAALANIARKNGDHFHAAEHMRSAAQTIQYILEHSPADVAAAIKALPEVKEVLSAAAKGKPA